MTHVEIESALYEISSFLARGRVDAAMCHFDWLRERLRDPRTTGQIVCDKYGAMRATT